jgi:hypothetical protein
MKNGFAARTLLVAVIALLLVACGKPEGPGGEIWKEEVRLMNGDLIIVDRRNVWGQSGDLSQGHGPLTKAELHFDYKGKRYDWVQRGLGPVALQEDPEGRMYVVSIIPYCWAWSEWGKPNSYYLVHRFEDGKWKRLDVTEVDQATVFNLASKSSEPDSMESRDYVPETATKYATNRGIHAPKRKIVLSHKPNCR